jgi:hypothetical protein
VKIHPRVAKDASKEDRQNRGTIKRLDSATIDQQLFSLSEFLRCSLPVPDDANNGSDKNEEVSTIHSHTRSTEYRTKISQYGENASLLGSTRTSQGGIWRQGAPYKQQWSQPRRLPERRKQTIAAMSAKVRQYPKKHQSVYLPNL